MTRNVCAQPCAYPEVQEDAAPAFFRKDVNGFWSITRNPGVDVTNLVSNPSIEFNLDGWDSPNNNTVSRVAGGYRGIFSLRAITAGGGMPFIDVAFSSLFFASPFPQIDLPAGATYYGKVAVLACPGDTVFASLINDGIAPGLPVIEAAANTVGTGDWQVLEFSATNPNAFAVPVAMYIRSDNESGCDELFVDGAIISAIDVDIFDGDSPFARWLGALHASESRAEAETRGWGQTINLSSYGFELITDEGFGYPPVQLITSNFARRAGASYQRTQILPRVLTLIGRFESADPVAIHKARHELIRDLGLWDITNCGQELILKYQYTDACGKPLCEEFQIAVEYSGGLEGIRTSMMYEQIILQFVANEDPFWRSQNNTGVELVNGNNTVPYEGTAPASVRLRFVGPMTLNSIGNQTNGATITFGVPGPGFVLPAGQYISMRTQPGRVVANIFDQATGALIGPVPINYAASQPGRFRLTPTAAEQNIIALDVAGGESTMIWDDSWLSVDSALRNC